MCAQQTNGFCTYKLCSFHKYIVAHGVKWRVYSYRPLVRSLARPFARSLGWLKQCRFEIAQIKIQCYAVPVAYVHLPHDGIKSGTASKRRAFEKVAKSLIASCVVVYVICVLYTYVCVCGMFCIESVYRGFAVALHFRHPSILNSKTWKTSGFCHKLTHITFGVHSEHTHSLGHFSWIRFIAFYMGHILFFLGMLILKLILVHFEFHYLVVHKN